MNEPEKKRKRDGRGDGPPAAEEGGGVGAARDSIMVDVMRTMLEQTQLAAQMQERNVKLFEMIDAMERRNDELAKTCQHQEERCRVLEARCDSLERSVEILAKNQNWESSAPDIPDASYWLEQGFTGEYVEEMEEFIGRMKDDTRRMRSGEKVRFIRFGLDDEQNVILHDDALLPHWQEFADALQLSNYIGDFCMGRIELSSSVLDMIAPALATKKVKSLRLGGNGFGGTSDGIKFATELIQNNPHLERFVWIGNPIQNMNQANDILEVVISHPTLNTIRLENSFGPNVNGHEILCSLLANNKKFKHIDFESSNIDTGGRTILPDFLATNPPLQFLCLANNNLDDDDAVFISDALKLNVNLQAIDLGENHITRIGRNALYNAVFNPTSLNSMADCNHTCQICSLGFDDKNMNSKPTLNRGQKLYSLLVSKYLEGSHWNSLDFEFGDNAVKFVPKVLECVNVYSEYFRRVPQLPAQPLSIIFEILRGWKMPELFEGHTR